MTSTARILVVDDNDDNLYTLTERLKREGYPELAVAGDGQAALELLEHKSFDLVLLDVMMPVLDGIVTLERLKAHPRLHHIPVIMISAVSDLDRVVRCIELGAEDYLPKPFEKVILRARVGASLERKRLRDAEQARLAEIEAQRQRLASCLHALLPAPAVAELTSTGQVLPRRYENVVVMFADIVGFTQYCDAQSPETVVAELDLFARACERQAREHGLEKIKTVGDAVLLTGNLLQPHPDPVYACVRCARAMLGTARGLAAGWQLRVGIHRGPVVAGVVGEEKFGFDIWGDTVNVAARLSELAETPAIYLSESTGRMIAERCAAEALGGIGIKGKAALSVYRCRFD